MTPKLSYELTNNFSESVWAKGSSNSGGPLYIFTSSHLHIFTSTHAIFTYSHLHIFTSSHLHIFISSHIIFAYLRLFTSSDLHIYTYRLHIFTSYPHISSSHLHIYTYHFHVFTSSHLHILPSRLHIFSLSLPLFLFSLEAAGGADEAPRNGYPFARNDGRSSKTEVTLRFWGFQCLCVRGLCINAFVCV